MKKPFAYITAVWKGGEFTVIDQAAVYCRKVYEAGFTPICPVLYLPHFLRDSIPAEHKDGIDIGRELLRRSHVLIVCGDEVDESVYHCRYVTVTGILHSGGAVPGKDFVYVLNNTGYRRIGSHELPYHVQHLYPAR